MACKAGKAGALSVWARGPSRVSKAQPASSKPTTARKAELTAAGEMGRRRLLIEANNCNPPRVEDWQPKGRLTHPDRSGGIGRKAESSERSFDPSGALEASANERYPANFPAAKPGNTGDRGRPRKVVARNRGSRRSAGLECSA